MTVLFVPEVSPQGPDTKDPTERVKVAMPGGCSDGEQAPDILPFPSLLSPLISEG